MVWTVIQIGVTDMVTFPQYTRIIKCTEDLEGHMRISLGNNDTEEIVFNHSI